MADNKFVANKTEPYIFSGKYQAMSDIQETYWWKAYVMTRKFKGKKTATYTDKGEAVLISRDKLTKQYVIPRLIEQAENIARKGKYHDWMWRPKPTGTVAIFAPPPLLKETNKEDV